MVQQRGYQYHLLQEYSVLKEVKGRTQKFRKILSFLQDFYPETQSLNWLDIECSSGIITSLLGNHFRMSIGMDIDREAVQYAKNQSASPHIHFIIADSMALPFQHNSIDVIVCNQIYEHVPYANQMMEEIYRVLKEDGFCYFSAGNKYAIIEGDYRLPFLSWLPKFLAHLYLKITGNGNFYYEECYSLWGLRRLARKFRIHDYTLPIIRNPKKFFATDIINSDSFLYRWIYLFAPHLYPWIPTYIWVLTKK